MTRVGNKIKEWARKRKWRVKVKTPILIIILLPLLFLDATLLRLNHIKMAELRENVMSADVEENDEKLAEALTELKEFVFSNIVINVVEENGEQKIAFGTGPFYLEHKYLRDATKALEEAEKVVDDRNPYGNIYGIAGNVCRAQATQNGWNWSSPEYINCMLTETQKYPSAQDLQEKLIAALPSTELYRRNYASPIWTFSPAGVMLLITLIVIVVILIRFITFIVLRLSLLFV